MGKAYNHPGARIVQVTWHSRTPGRGGPRVPYLFPNPSEHQHRTLSSPIAATHASIAVAGELRPRCRPAAHVLYRVGTRQHRRWRWSHRHGFLLARRPRRLTSISVSDVDDHEGCFHLRLRRPRWPASNLHRQAPPTPTPPRQVWCFAPAAKGRPRAAAQRCCLRQM